jgi:copper(I)-binding protein
MSRYWSGLSVAAAALMLVATQAGAHAYQLGPLKIGHPWTRPTPPSAPTAAGFLTVTNTGSAPDRFLGGSSPLVDHIEIHLMTMTDGVMRMRPVMGGLVIAPGATVTLSPMSYHLMMFGPKQPFKLGDRIPATLRFEHAGEIKVEFVVQAQPPADAPMGGMPGMGH